MQKFHLLTVSAIALALAILLGACDDGPTGPSPQLPGADATTAALTISGPDTVGPGETAQFTAIARRSDGSTRNVTNEAVWTTGNQSVLTVSPRGAATGADRGESSIQAWFGGQFAVINEVIVVPAGTYRLTGRLTEAGSAVTVANARIEVTAGIGQGLATTTTGQFRFYGVAGDIEIRVTADGYQEERKRLHVANHQNVDFDLNFVGPRTNLSGTYTLRITAAAECRASLPADAITRTFTAGLRQESTWALVELQGAQFVVNAGRTYNRFGGQVQPGRVTFYIEGPLDFYYASYGPDVVEQLTDTTFYTMSGVAQASFSSGAIVSGLLDGLVETVRSGVPGRLERIASCRSAQHQFVLSR